VLLIERQGKSVVNDINGPHPLSGFFTMKQYLREEGSAKDQQREKEEESHDGICKVGHLRSGKQFSLALHPVFPL